MRFTNNIKRVFTQRLPHRVEEDEDQVREIA